MFSGRAAEWLAALAVALALTACATTQQPAQRSRTELAAFKRVNPCPDTGRPSGACPGWEVDHIIPLCNGGPDKPDNMQWLTVDAHREKTKTDVRVCAAKRADHRTYRLAPDGAMQ